MKVSPHDPIADQRRRAARVAVAAGVLLTMGLMGLLGRVVQIQHKPDEPIRQRVRSTGRDGTLLARRGALLDRRGRPIAVTHFGYRLYADPSLIEDFATFSARVGHAISMDPAAIDQILDERAHTRYAVLVPLLEEDQLARVRELKIRALALEPSPVRTYPSGPRAGQLIGFVGTDHVGLDGLERLLEKRLHGAPGQVRTLHDVRHRSLWIERADYRPPVDGADMKLSLDLVIQGIAEEELAAACSQFKAKRGELIVMDPRNGQVLAMANWPLFDPSDPNARQSAELRRNRCITDPYEPGSVFKPVIHAAVTAAGVMRGTERIDCGESGMKYFGRRRLNDSHPHGVISWDQVLVVSSNIGMAEAGTRLGQPRLYQAVRGFGFGRRSGVGLPGESAGIVNPLRQWTSYSVSSIPMGQEIAVTPIQMVKAFSAFANDGLIATPSVLHEEAAAPILQRAIDAGTAKHTREVLRRVVTEGTGRKADSDLYRIWGKTGTAQVSDRVHGGYKEGAYTANFICGAPLDAPRLVVLVTVHEPDRALGYYGGTVAGPAAKKTIDRTLLYLGVPSDQPREADEREAPRIYTAQVD